MSVKKQKLPECGIMVRVWKAREVCASLVPQALLQTQLQDSQNPFCDALRNLSVAATGIVWQFISLGVESVAAAFRSSIFRSYFSFFFFFPIMNRTFCRLRP